jgi:hypothetical protein
VAEEQAGVASGAEVAGVNIFGQEACGQELRPIGFAKIEVDVFRGWLVAGRFHVEPLERIGLFAGAGLVEIVGSVGELRGKFGDEVGGNFVAARANRGTDGGQEIGGLAAEFESHAANGFLGDAGEGAAPTGVDGGNGALFRIDEEYRDAIGGLDGEEEAGANRGGGVSFAVASRRLRENSNYIRVDLLERNEFKITCINGGLKEAAIFEDVFAGIPIHKAEIEDFFGFERTNSTGAGAEAVDKPGKLEEGGELENLQAAGLAQPPRLSDTWDRRRRGRGLTRAAALQ